MDKPEAAVLNTGSLRVFHWSKLKVQSSFSGVRWVCANSCNHGNCVLRRVVRSTLSSPGQFLLRFLRVIQRTIIARCLLVLFTTFFLIELFCLFTAHEVAATPRVLSVLTTICQLGGKMSRMSEGECSRSASGVMKRSGAGKHTSAGGIIYTGEWMEDQMNGRGALQHPSGALYEGELKGNMYHGTGTYTFPDGSTYKGHFHNNRLKGDGAFTDTQGLVWIGEFLGKAALGLKMQHTYTKQA
ncbi:MORN repeat-containing protein 2 isoform X2 [Cyclopterus lumpus]|uniref:MORN repeat-containing protein 2 isoform X2 n=2 Tax=Cyclopterus lumpus TaxID=8103 RepID=UPI001485FD2D|nr:MORN repeat-containing protein 2 isoform X2 [Cyclopterus lumpus]